VPENAFLVCSFWYVNALCSLGRREESRALFEKLLSFRNRHGLLAEHINPTTGEQWGNFVQTYSMVGLINSAIRLSIHWIRLSEPAQMIAGPIPQECIASQSP